MMEMKILVCDDEEAVRLQVQNTVEELLGKGSCMVCEDGSSLFKTVNEHKFDAVIMDIEWDGEEKGIRYAERLKEIAPSTAIIFMTGYTSKYIQQIFLHSSSLSGFLMKPLNPELLRENLKKVLANQTDDGISRFTFQYKGTVYSLDFDKILYIESTGRMLRIYTKAEKFDCIAKLSEAEKAFPEQFIRCHQSYLVNMDYIQRIEKDHTLLLETGHKLPVSKLRYGKTQAAFYEYISENAFRGYRK